MTEEKKNKNRKKIIPYVYYGKFIFSWLWYLIFGKKYHENNNNNTFIYVALVSSAQGAYNHTKSYVIN